ncbi:MAG: hypothetical protein GY741_02220 [Phycisphaeraceae bacterium]|nr:hypothetical protein [Phycisphaeraceae bacterium]
MNRSTAGPLLASLGFAAIFCGIAEATDDPSPENPFVYERSVWLETGPASGSIEAEDFDRVPDRSEVVDRPEGFSDAGDGSRQRLRGWIEAPRTGAYRFSIASDDDGVLLLSTSEDPAGGRPIASVRGFTGRDEFDRQPTQVSRPIVLIKGRRYHLEARQRNIDGEGHLSVGWQVPGGPAGVYVPVGMRLEPAFRLEVWNGVARGEPGSLEVFRTPPSRVDHLHSMYARDVGTNVATRLRGRFRAPASGEYRFRVTADDLAMLRLDRSSDSRGWRRIAGLSSWTPPDGWEGRPEQVSEPVELAAGEVVELEVLHWQGSGPGHVGVGVSGPNGLDSRPLRAVAIPDRKTESETR